jgi:hypothetical protein
LEGVEGSKKRVKHTALGLIGTLDHWESQVVSLGDGERNAMKFVKWKLAAFRAHYAQCDLPEGLKTAAPEDPAVLLGGRAHRWLRSQLRVWSPAELHGFLATIRSSKMAMPRPSKALCQEEAEAARVKLTTEKPHPEGALLLPWGDVEENGPEAVLSRATAQAQLRRSVKELFAGQVFSAIDRISPTFPSTKSCYGKKRDEMGSVGAIVQAPWFQSLRTKETLVKTKTIREHFAANPRLQSPNPNPQFVDAPKRLDLPFENRPVPRVITPAGTVNQRPMRPSLPNGREPKKVLVDDTGLRVQAGLLWKRVLEAAEVEKPYVKMVSLPEALKIRTISKGPPFTYFVLKALQKFMWRVLKVHPVFQLIGSPVDARAVFERMGKLSPGKSFLSGDYQAATDNFAPWVSETILEAISDEIGLSPLERELFGRAMTRHEFPGKGEDPVLQQKWGQLMGSIVSFPVLCIANFAWCRWALEIDSLRKIPSRDARLLVNGDDCLFQVTETGRQAWRKISSFGGLIESIGKTFFSRSFAEINSETFLYNEATSREETWTKTVTDPDGRERQTDCIRWNPFTAAPAINLGLVYGMKRSGKAVGLDDVLGSYEDDGDKTITERHSALFRSCPPDKWPVVNRLFMQHHSVLLQQLTSWGVPWFVPTWLGGLGLVGEISNTDLHLAAGIVRDWAVLPPSKRPSRPKRDTPWKTHQLVMEQTRHLDAAKAVLNSSGIELSDRFYGLLCAETLFTADESDMYVEVEDDPEKPTKDVGYREIRRNGNLWRRRFDNRSFAPIPIIEGPWRTADERTLMVVDALRARTTDGWNIVFARTSVPDLRSLPQTYLDRDGNAPIRALARRTGSLLSSRPSGPSPQGARTAVFYRGSENPNNVGLGLA